MHPNYESPVLAVAVGIGAVAVGAASSLGRCGPPLPGADARIVAVAVERIVYAVGGTTCAATGPDAAALWIGVAAAALGLLGGAVRVVFG